MWLDDICTKQELRETIVFCKKNTNPVLQSHGGFAYNIPTELPILFAEHPFM